MPQASATTSDPVPDVPTVEKNDGLNRDLNDDRILSRQSLQEFVAGNVKFYGQPISVEVDNIEIKEAMRFIANESGLNLVISEAVKKCGVT